MEKARERIFGIVVISSLLVIFGPMLYEATKQHRIQMAQTLPEAPSPSLKPTFEKYLTAGSEVKLEQPFSQQSKHYVEQVIDDKTDTEQAEQDLISKKITETQTPILTEQSKISKEIAPKQINPKKSISASESQALANNQVSTLAPTLKEKPDLKTKQLHKPKPKPELALVEVSKPTIDNIEQKQAQQSSLSTKSIPSQQLASLNKGWSVQLGTFGNEANASRLLKKLKSSGYPAYIKTKSSSGKTLNLVLVGPQIDKESAETLRATLLEQFGLKGIVIKYQPN